MAGKCHFRHASQQATVTSVVIGQHPLLGAKFIDGVDHANQVLRIIQIRHVCACLIQHLRQNAATHALLATAQIDQDQTGIGFAGIELGCEIAADIV